MTPLSCDVVPKLAITAAYDGWDFFAACTYYGFVQCVQVLQLLNHMSLWCPRILGRLDSRWLTNMRMLSLTYEILEGLYNTELQAMVTMNRSMEELRCRPGPWQWFDCVNYDFAST